MYRPVRCTNLHPNWIWPNTAEHVLSIRHGFTNLDPNWTHTSWIHQSPSELDVLNIRHGSTVNINRQAVAHINKLCDKTTIDRQLLRTLYQVGSSFFRCHAVGLSCGRHNMHTYDIYPHTQWTTGKRQWTQKVKKKKKEQRSNLK